MSKVYEKEIRIGLIGNVDAGKSSLCGVLVTGELDDGRGKARDSIFMHAHEKVSGRTSSITQRYLRISEDKYINFVDLAGHEKYLKTTILGMTGYHLDYVVAIISANDGVMHMTIEHIKTALVLKIPVIIVITKIDVAPKFVRQETLKGIATFLTKRKRKYCFIADWEKEKEGFNIEKTIPVFAVSNKTGTNIDKFRTFLYDLKQRYEWPVETMDEDKPMFNIDSVFKVKGVGTVFSGKVLKGKLTKNNKFYVGPFHNNWVEVSSKSFHNNFREDISELHAGESGCIAVNVNEKDLAEKTGTRSGGRFKRKIKIKKGRVLLSNPDTHVTKSFNADVYIFSEHTTTIKKNYQPVINCNKVAQSARICDMDKDFMRVNEKTSVSFEFLYKPEFLFKGDYFVFREGKTRGVGIIKSTSNKNILTDEERDILVSESRKNKPSHNK